ncbi:MAG: hypothetical protein ACXW61_08550, partial [Gemmatirosa sp.]
RRRSSALSARTRVARTPRHLRVVRGEGGTDPRPPRDVRAALASLLVPGLGQLLQHRRRAAGVHAAVAALLIATWAVGAVSGRITIALLAAWTVGVVVDAARHRPRPPLRRA